MPPRPIHLQTLLLLLFTCTFITQTQPSPLPLPPSPSPPSASASTPHPNVTKTSQTQRELPPTYHCIFNLLWASLTFFQTVISYRILQKFIPLSESTRKTRASFTFVFGALVARSCSHLLAALFAVVVLPSRNLQVQVNGERRSLIGTVADGMTLMVDPLLFVGVLLPIWRREQHWYPLWPFPRAFKVLRFTHETLDRIFLGCLVFSIVGFTGISYIHPTPLESGYDLLGTMYSVYLAALLVMSVDCMVWGGIMMYREKKRGIKFPQHAIPIPILGVFMFGIWSLRLIRSRPGFDNLNQSQSQNQFPIPLVADFLSQILMQAFMYSFCFCLLMVSLVSRLELEHGLGSGSEASEVQGKVAIGGADAVFMSLGATIILFFGIVFVFSQLFP